MFHMISLVLHQCQRSKTQQKADEISMFHAIDRNCRFTQFDMNHSMTMTYKLYFFVLTGYVAYIREVNSPNWKPTLNLGHDEGKRVNNAWYERLRECSVLKSSGTSTEQTEDIIYVKSMMLMAKNLLVLRDRLLLLTATTMGFFCFVFCLCVCQTELDIIAMTTLSMLTLQHEKLVRDELDRLTQENRVKGKPAN